MSDELSKKLLIGLIAVAFLLRITGISYGLPLWLVSDEPSFITSALKMLELKTVLPVLHQKEFAGFLYYPPYISYAYLLPFTALTGVKYLTFGGNPDVFKNYLLADLSQFFILARFFNILLAMASVWLVYKTAKNIFNDNLPAIAAAAFLTLSITHIHLSTIATHWIPATFIFALGMWILSRTNKPLGQRVIWGSLIAGFGFGISVMAAVLMLFLYLTYFFEKSGGLINIAKEKYIWKGTIYFLLLASLPAILYPGSFGFAPDSSLKASKSLIDLIVSPATFLKFIFLSEPVLVALAILGLFFCFKNKRDYFWTAFLLIASYGAAFYLIFHYRQRFTVYLIPLLAILAGYGFAKSYQATLSKHFSKALLIIFIIPVAASLKLSWLKFNNDNRIQARNWAENNIQAGTKIITYAGLTRLSSLPAAIDEQTTIDPSSLRKVDAAEKTLGANPFARKSFHALNLYTVGNNNFYENLNNYLSDNKYEYALISAKKSENLYYLEKFNPIITNSQLIQSFGSQNNLDDFANGSLENIIKLLKADSVGEPVAIYKL